MELWHGVEDGVAATLSMGSGFRGNGGGIFDGGGGGCGEANPGYALLLGDYAKFLKDVNVKTIFLFASPDMLGNLKKFHNFNSFILLFILAWTS